MKFMSLTDDQQEILKELEARPDHTETVRKAGLIDGKVFSMVYFEDEKRVQCAVVYPDGALNWETRPKVEGWDLPPLTEESNG